MSEFKKLQERINNREMDIEVGRQLKLAEKEAKLEKLRKKLGLKTNAQWTAEHKFKQDKEYNSIPLTTKQKFLDHMHNDSMNVGQASAACGITADMGSQVILRNAKHSTYEMWPTKAVE